MILAASRVTEIAVGHRPQSLLRLKRLQPHRWHCRRRQHRPVAYRWRPAALPAITGSVGAGDGVSAPLPRALALFFAPGLPLAALALAASGGGIRCGRGRSEQLRRIGVDLGTALDRGTRDSRWISCSCVVPGRGFGTELAQLRVRALASGLRGIGHRRGKTATAARARTGINAGAGGAARARRGTHALCGRITAGPRPRSWAHRSRRRRCSPRRWRMRRLTLWRTSACTPLALGTLIRVRAGCGDPPALRPRSAPCR